MAKKKTSTRKSGQSAARKGGAAKATVRKGGARKSARPKPRPAPSSGDQSRIDTKPIQEHIKRRIRDIKGGGTTSRTTGSDEDTLARLQNALDTLEDICDPSMFLPI